MRATTTAFLTVVACGTADPAPRPAPATPAVAPATPAAAPATPAAGPAEPARSEPAPSQVGLMTSGDQDGAGLTADEVHSVVKARRADIDACYQAELRQHTSLRGKLVVSWYIGPDGTARDVKLRSTTMNNPTVEACVMRQVSQLVFRSPDGLKVNVNFPFLFEPRGQ